jgi:6-phosphogluconolactonase (cycloisomerase 2 family)
MRTSEGEAGVRARRSFARLKNWALLLSLGAACFGACGKGIYSGNSSSSGGGGGGGTTLRSVYVSNFADGKLSSLNQSSGTLSAPRTIASGKSNGPVGLATNLGSGTLSALYVANAADNKIHEFKLDSNGNFSDLATVAAGNAPQQVVVTTSGTFAYSINHSGSISQYTINSTTGALTRNSTTSGLVNPVSGVATDSFVYVTDPLSGAGIVSSYGINADGTLAFTSEAPSQGIPGGASNPAQIVIDPTGTWVFVSDATNGAVSVFQVQGNGLVLFSVTAATGSAAAGLAYATTSAGANFLFVANPAANIVTLFSFDTTSGLLTPVTSATGLSAPTGLAVDTTSSFLFVTNQSSGTVSSFSIDAATGVPSFINSFSTENPANNASSPQFIIVTS